MTDGDQNSWAFVQWAREQHVGHKAAKAVLIAIATCADWRTGSCILEQGTIASYTEQGSSTVRAALKRLEDDGFIRRRHRAGYKRRLADEITLTPSAANPLTPASGGSDRSTTAKRERTTARNERPLPPEAGGGRTHQREHARKKDQSSASMAEVLKALPVGCRKKTSADAMAQRMGRYPGVALPELLEAARRFAEAEPDSDRPAHWWIEDGDFRAWLPAKPDEIDWTVRLDVWNRQNTWPRALWGPTPGEPGCRVPVDLLPPRKVGGVTDLGYC